MIERDRIEFDGEVISVAKDRFTVKVNDNYSVICTLSGKIRQSGVKVILNDKVRIEVCSYDTSKGRIIYRLK